jgi:hypothetical protein
MGITAYQVGNNLVRHLAAPDFLWREPVGVEQHRSSIITLTPLQIATSDIQQVTRAALFWQTHKIGPRDIFGSFDHPATTLHISQRRDLVHTSRVRPRRRIQYMTTSATWLRCCCSSGSLTLVTGLCHSTTCRYGQSP